MTENSKSDDLEEVERERVTGFIESQFHNLVEAIECPVEDCDQGITLANFVDDGETECSRCRTTVVLEVSAHGSNDPTR